MIVVDNPTTRTGPSARATLRANGWGAWRGFPSSGGRGGDIDVEPTILLFEREGGDPVLLETGLAHARCVMELPEVPRAFDEAGLVDPPVAERAARVVAHPGNGAEAAVAKRQRDAGPPRALPARASPRGRRSRRRRSTYLRSRRTTSLSADQTSVTAQTLMSTKPSGSASARIMSSVTSVATPADFFGHETHTASPHRAPRDSAQRLCEFRFLRRNDGRRRPWHGRRPRSWRRRATAPGV